MTKKEALKKVEEIKKIAYDDEKAHSLEDDFRAEFIYDVSKRKSKLGEIAKIVLSTQDISFRRFCA